MPPEPPTKRAVAFVDGQNLFWMAKHAFGYRYPNYDPVALAQAVGGAPLGWSLTETRFYTGVPDSSEPGVTDWLPFDEQTYDGCLDPVDYRPKA